MKKINLQKFCSTNKNRKPICQPFKLGDYVYATNGCILVQVEASDYPEFGEVEKAPHVEQLLIGHKSTAAMALASIVLPHRAQNKCKHCDGKGSGPKQEECEICAGSGSHDCECGTVHECGHCRGTGNVNVSGEQPCEYCEGTGKDTKFDRVILFGDTIVSQDYLELFISEFGLGFGVISKGDNNLALLKITSPHAIGGLMPIRSDV
jgi:hypothetical protein